MGPSKADILGKVIRDAIDRYGSIGEIDIYGLWCIEQIEEFEALVNQLGGTLDEQKPNAEDLNED